MRRLVTAVVSAVIEFVSYMSKVFSLRISFK